MADLNLAKSPRSQRLFKLLDLRVYLNRNVHVVLKDVKSWATPWQKHKLIALLRIHEAVIDHRYHHGMYEVGTTIDITME